MPGSRDPVAGRYIVTLHPTSASIAELAAQLTERHGGRVALVFTRALQGFAVQLTDRQAQALAQDRLVASIEPDRYVHASDTETPAPWGLDRIDQRDHPLDDSYSYDRDGASVHVYVLDSGIRTTNVDFGGRATVGVDEIGDGYNGQDCSGHGTHVAGTIGGSTYGVAKGRSSSRFGCSIARSSARTPRRLRESTGSPRTRSNRLSRT